MAIEITEEMRVDVPIGVAWAFITDARRVAACMPGATSISRTYLSFPRGHQTIPRRSNGPYEFTVDWASC